MKISLKAGAVIVCALFAVLMLPIVITCFYTYPVLDDFSFGAAAHHAVMDGTNVLWAALQNAHFFYMNWQGAYTSNLFASIQPFVWNVRLYFLSNLSVLLLTSGVMLYFFYILLCGAFHAPKSLWLISSLLRLLRLRNLGNLLLQGKPRQHSPGKLLFPVLYLQHRRHDDLPHRLAGEKISGACGD